MKILITAGPTREPIDPVRYISNRSSGKMGYAIAEAAAKTGHEVVLISGPVALARPAGMQVVNVVTSEEMYHVAHQWVGWADVCVLCAAVADFRPAQMEAQKIKKGSRTSLHLELVPTRDILRSLHEWRGGRRRPVLVGFAAETNDWIKNARRKLHDKGCALMVLNDVSRTDAGFETDNNELTLLFASGETCLVPMASKKALGVALVDIFFSLTQNVVDDVSGDRY